MADQLDTRRAAATAVALGRFGYGGLMAVFPRRMLRAQLGGDPSGGFVWLARAFGARDAILGAGVLLAPDDRTRRGWVAAGAAADGTDLVSALVGGRWLGRGRALAVAATAASATAAAVWSLAADDRRRP